MRHSSLLSFLNGESLAKQLWEDIESEVRDSLAATAKGGAGHVIITDGPDTVVTRHHADRLLRALADDCLPLAAASYIADALIMSDDFNFADEAVSGALFYLSDESGPLSRDEVHGLRSRLSNAA